MRPACSCNAALVLIVEKTINISAIFPDTGSALIFRSIYPAQPARIRLFSNKLELLYDENNLHRI